MRIERLTLGGVIVLALIVPAPHTLASGDDIGDILDANRIACGGDAWEKKTTLETAFDYSGQGLTGTITSVVDLEGGWFVDGHDIGPMKGAHGWDGATAWMKDISGTVTPQAGGDKPVAMIGP